MRFYILALCLFGCAMAMANGREVSSVVEAEINGLKLVVDGRTGCLLEMSHPAMGLVLKATSPHEASMLDLAVPYQGFEFLRANARSSQGAKIVKSETGLTIRWERLGASRPTLAPTGAIAATVTFKAAPDGQSILMTCSIDNQSSASVRQVFFPDFQGLLPFAGEEGTEFRSCGFAEKPFIRLKGTPEGCSQYCSPVNIGTYTAGAFFASSDRTMFGRWMDFGSHQGGFSLFPKLWSWGPLTSGQEMQTSRVFLHRNQIDGKIRLMCEHKVEVAKGQKWTSPEYILTPHKLGWAKGIQPFTGWVEQNKKRPFPSPRHIREAIGFRTIYMGDQYLNDPIPEKTITWRYTDLPGVAQEAIAHGLPEVVIWNIVPYFQLPFEKFPTQFGTELELRQAVAAAKKLGVHLTPFVSFLSLANPSLKKYGGTTSPGNGWTYHMEMIPRFNPYYATASETGGVPQSNAQYRADILASLKRLADAGMSSISWDQVMANPPTGPNLYTIFHEYRDYARKLDPESSLSGESATNLDLDSRYLDYTWDWGSWYEKQDYRALAYAYTTPRCNVNVETSPKAVKALFADNTFINVMPSRPEGINGSARITDYPELSRALKTCASRRKQFLPYFVEGKLVGDCLLDKPAVLPARLNAYLLEHKALVLVMNRGEQAQSFSFKADLAPWVASKSGRYQIKTFNEQGRQTSAMDLDRGTWTITTPELKGLEMVFYEVTAK